MNRIIAIFLLVVSYSYAGDSSEFVSVNRSDFQAAGVAYSVNVMRVVDRQAVIHAQYALVCPHALEKSRQAMLVCQPNLSTGSEPRSTEQGHPKIFVMLNESVRIVPETDRIYFVSTKEDTVVETIPIEPCKGSNEDFIRAVIDEVRQRVEPGATDNPDSAQ